MLRANTAKTRQVDTFAPDLADKRPLKGWEMQAHAVVFEKPGTVTVQDLALDDMGPADVLVDVAWSGISTGTERLLWTGKMPPFPGMGYPLVPGYESVGRVCDAGADAHHRPGDWVFVPGASCFGPVKGLFGGAAETLVIKDSRAVSIREDLKDQGVLLALAATARHAVAGHTPPDLIVGHGVLGRLLARLTVALGHPAPTVWEANPARRSGAFGYAVVDPEEDPKSDYSAIYDVSGDSGLLDTLIGRLAPGGEVVLAGFYDQRLSFAHVPAFLKEARLRVAAEWKPADLAATAQLINDGALPLDNLITSRVDASHAEDAYATVFEDSDCLKMVLNWRNLR